MGRATGKPGAEGSKGERRSGLRPIGETTSRIAAPIVARSGGGVLSRLKGQWHAVVGADLALQAWPEKLGRDGALRLRVVPGFALDLQHRALLVVERINIFFGRVAVKRLVLVQGMLPVAGSAPAGSVSPAPGTIAAANEAGSSEPRASDSGAFDSRLAGIDDPELRAALAGLAELVVGTPRREG